MSRYQFYLLFENCNNLTDVLRLSSNQLLFMSAMFIPSFHWIFSNLITLFYYTSRILCKLELNRTRKKRWIKRDVEDNWIIWLINHRFIWANTSFFETELANLFFSVFFSLNHAYALNVYFISELKSKKKSKIWIWHRLPHCYREQREFWLLKTTWILSLSLAWPI